MFWLGNKKNNFQLRTVIWGPGANKNSIVKPDSWLNHKPTDLGPHCFQRYGKIIEKSSVHSDFIPANMVVSFNAIFSKTCLKRPLKNRQNKDLNDKL